jgi:hypothetical protein
MASTSVHRIVVVVAVVIDAYERNGARIFAHRIQAKRRDFA